MSARTAARRIVTAAARTLTTVAGLAPALVFAGLLHGGCGEGETEPATLDPTADNVPVPVEVLRNAASGLRTFSTGPTRLYLNFDGVTITKAATSDAAINSSFIGGGVVPPFQGDSATRDQIRALVGSMFTPFNIQLTTSRPVSGSYGMVVIGGTPENLGLSYESNVTGVAPMDCGDLIERDVSFVFSDRLLALVPSQYALRVAETIAHEAAHTYGLPHSNQACDVMSYGLCASMKRFLDQTMGLQDTSNNCGMTSMNSHQLLLKSLGSASAAVDNAAPQVVITSPANGAMVQSALVVTATITDNSGVTAADLIADGALVSTCTAPPYSFSVQLAKGAHQLTVRASDQAGNRGSASVSVTGCNLTGAAGAESLFPGAMLFCLLWAAHRRRGTAA